MVRSGGWVTPRTPGSLVLVITMTTSVSDVGARTTMQGRRGSGSDPPKIQVSAQYTSPTAGSFSPVSLGSCRFPSTYMDTDGAPRLPVRPPPGFSLFALHHLARIRPDSLRRRRGDEIAGHDARDGPNTSQ